MLGWWESLTALQRIFAAAAIPATLILLIQTALLLAGMGGHDHDMEHGHGFGAHTDHEHDPGLRIFSVRAFVAFFTIFGWLGLSLSRGGLGEALSVLLAVCAGVAAMFAMAWLFKLALGLQSQGNIDARNAVGKSGAVYIPVPRSREGLGKVTLVLQGRFSEMDALTDYEYPLTTGTEVIVVSVSNQNVLCVMPKTTN